MAKKTYEERIKQAEARLADLRRRAAEQRRKRETRAKIIAGAMLIEHYRRGEPAAQEAMRRVLEACTERDRQALQEHLES